MTASSRTCPRGLRTGRPPRPPGKSSWSACRPPRPPPAPPRRRHRRVLSTGAVPLARCSRLLACHLPIAPLTLMHVSLAAGVGPLAVGGSVSRRARRDSVTLRVDPVVMRPGAGEVRRWQLPHSPAASDTVTLSSSRQQRSEVHEHEREHGGPQGKGQPGPPCQVKGFALQ